MMDDMTKKLEDPAENTNMAPAVMIRIWERMESLQKVISQIEGARLSAEKAVAEIEAEAERRTREARQSLRSAEEIFARAETLREQSHFMKEKAESEAAQAQSETRQLEQRKIEIGNKVKELQELCQSQEEREKSIREALSEKGKELEDLERRSRQLRPSRKRKPQRKRLNEP
jgi:DNA repair exonuclease SbcCD ATPase subunit